MSSRLAALLQFTFVLGVFTASSTFCSAPAPTVQLDDATVIGSTNNAVTSYLGIPFAQPPVGNLRLRRPKPVGSYNGTIDATRPPTQCVQLIPPIRTDMPPDMLQDVESYLGSQLLTSPVPEGEDCLTVNVQVPDGTSADAKLPVVAFIFGGGFTTGSTAQMPGDSFVQRSMQLNKPVIFVAMNYRLHVFGFLGGKEVKDAGVGNLGLHDQREGLRWISKHIAAFGGDPKKVTLWGPSSGAISIALQMVTNDGSTEGLFRGAIMNAGSPIPTSDIVNQQPYYDTIVEHAGCVNSTDTLECLRQVPADTLHAAAASIPNLFQYPGLATPWAPRADGVFLKAPPQHLVLAGSVAKIPFITGDALDEGTIFASGSFNVTTEREFRDYVHQFYFPRTPKATVAPLFELYPNDLAQGSPFGTGDANELAPMYKRMAAFQGDMIFQAPRRFFLDQRSSEQPTWSYITQRDGNPGLGFAHGNDFLLTFFKVSELMDHAIQFVATGNPNGAPNQTVSWPRYDTKSRQALMILQNGIAIGNDTMRLKPMAGLSALSVADPI